LPLVGHELRRRHGELPFTAAADQVKWFVKGADTKLRKRLRAATAPSDAGDPEVDELLYRARKAGERHRYALELAQSLSGVTGQEDDQEAAQAAGLLGEQQDRIVAADFMCSEDARIGVRSGHNGFSYGLLYARVRASVFLCRATSSSVGWR
jgi:hypothetical protein